MTNIYEIDKRLLVPNWRDFNRTTKIGELGGLKTNKIIQESDNSIIINDWHNSKTIGTAADLINNAFVSNELFSNELTEAIDLISENKEFASTSLLSLIQQIKKEMKMQNENSNILLEKKISSLEELESIFNPKLFNKIIHKTKNATKNHSRNAIYWVELSRLYTIKSQFEKAEKCIQIALNLAGNNRFVLRSATRFYIHTNQEEKAIFYLKKSDIIKNDPWIISAHVASSMLIGRYSPFLKKGIEIAQSKNFSNFDITELSSSIGTIELENGSFKKAKPFLETSIINPNDNSLAQFEWLSKKEDRIIFRKEDFQNVKNAFEAFAYENFNKGLIEEAFQNCIDWFLDMPYSKRPLMFGSYLASILENYDIAIMLCLIGLRYDSNEPGFTNNLIYNYCLKNDLEKAGDKLNQYFSNNKIENLSNENKITLQATIGLYLMKIGDLEGGKKMYKVALENSKIIKNDYYYNLALVNFTRELFLSKDIEFKEYLTKFENIISEDYDIVLEKEKVEKLIQHFP